MANFYVDSADGDDVTPPSVSWWNGNQSTYATVTGALAAATGVGPHVIYLSHTHAESSAAAITWNVATTNAHVAIISVNRTTGVWAAGASVTVGVNNAAFTITDSVTKVSHLRVFGMTLSGNNGSSGGNTMKIGVSPLVTQRLIFDNCNIKQPGTSTAATIQIGLQQAVAPAIITFRNCVFTTKNAATTAGIQIQRTNCEMIGCTHAFAGATKSPTCFSFGLNAGSFTIMDSDLSGFDAGNYFDVANVFSPVVLRNVKLHETPGIVTGTWPVNAPSIMQINADSADTIGYLALRNRLAAMTRDTAVYANSGFSHFGVKQSWKIVTTSLCTEYEPFITPWMAIPSEDVAEITAGLRVVHDSATDMHDRNLWAEFEYVSSASFPLGTLATNRNAEPFTGSAVDWTNDAEVWTGTGGFGNANTQTLAKTFTPAEKSLVRARLFIGVASKTLYVDPLLRIA